MTDPQTPATEAGRRLLRQLDGRPGPVSRADIIAIEAEARADARIGWVIYNEEYNRGRTDALREAADAVRAIATTHAWPRDVLAALQGILS